MKQKQKTEFKEKRQTIFGDKLEKVTCNICKHDLNIAMVLNHATNPRHEDEQSGISLYKVKCGNCKDETKHFSNTENHAISSWTTHQLKNLGNSVKK